MLYLCSSSESRALLLKKFNIDFIQKPILFDEDKIKSKVAKSFVYVASKGKLEAAEKTLGLEVPLLCADTVITASDGSILRKAKNVEDAMRILKMQSGSRVSIISSLHFKTNKFLFSNISTTEYLFDSFDEDDLQKYLESGEWQGKAGACMVEGFCKKYILSVCGQESTAMGLQVEKLLPWIRKN